MKYNYAYRNNSLLWSVIKERQDWCNDQLGERTIVWDRKTFPNGSEDETHSTNPGGLKVVDTFYFENEAHLNWFILRWS